MGLTETLSTLIGFRTVTGRNEELEHAYAWVREQLAGLPLYFYEHEFNGVPSLVITTKENQKNPKVWLAAHMDVVDGSEAVWHPREADGMLYGRGAHDMKFAIACYIELCKELGPALSGYDFGIMLAGDEEVGGANGTGALVAQAGYRGGIVLLPDGSGVWQFEEAAKGLCWFEITATGKSAHASRPWTGKSATHTMLRFLLEVEHIAGEFWQEDDEHWHLTHTISTFHGGHSHNQVADVATAMLDVRFPTDDELEAFRDKVEAAAEEHPRIRVRELQHSSPRAVSKEHTAARTFSRIAQKHGKTCSWTRSHGGSDARYFAPYDIPVLLIGPSAGGAHSEEEWIDTADLQLFYTVVKEWVQEIASGAVSESVGEAAIVSPKAKKMAQKAA